MKGDDCALVVPIEPATLLSRFAFLVDLRFGGPDGPSGVGLSNGLGLVFLLFALAPRLVDPVEGGIRGDASVGGKACGEP